MTLCTSKGSACRIRVARYYPQLMAKILVKMVKMAGFEKVMAKITKRFRGGNFYIHRALNFFGSQHIFVEKMTSQIVHIQFWVWYRNECQKSLDYRHPTDRDL